MSNVPKQVNGVIYHESILKEVCVIGIFGGLLWSAVGIVAAFFNYMDVSPKFILTSWSNAAWIKTWLGTVLTLLIYSMVSIVFAYLYYALFRKVNHISAGIVYGALFMACVCPFTSSVISWSSFFFKNDVKYGNYKYLFIYLIWCICRLFDFL